MGNVKLQRVETEEIPANYQSLWWWRGFWCCLVLNWTILLGCYFDVWPALWRALWGD